MHTTSSRVLAVALCAASCYAVAFGQQAAAPGAATRRIGAVKGISGMLITLTPDSGPDVNVTVQATTRIVRVAPGEKDLKNATPIQLQDLQVGDRILVAGKPSDDNLSLVASTVVVMKHSDLEARYQQDLQDWQKRGVDGLASAVDAAAGTVTISVRSKNVVIHTSSSTVVRRYALDSVKFDDAKASTLQEIHPGDQVRARGDRSADGTELTGEEIVSGSFRNIAGVVTTADASSSTLSVQDLLSKKTVLIKVTADSQLRHLPPEMAQRIAMRLKGAAAGTPSGAASSTNGQNAQAVAPGGMGAGGNGASGRPGGAPDFQQMLSRVPPASLADLHKGDAVIIVSTEGGTAITLLSGVEPILQAAPSASSAAILTPWSMSAPSGDSGGP
jgi:hypothetical protein